MVELTASVDRSFLLTASATCIPPAQVERLIVVPHQWSLPYSVTSMLAQELASKRAASEAKNALHLYCYELGVKIEEKEVGSSETFKRLLGLVHAFWTNGLLGGRSGFHIWHP